MADEACWSDEKEENLVALWSENPCIFDIQSKDYSNRLKKEAAYHDIAAKLNMTVDQVKKRMKSLRTQFGKLRKPGRSGSEAKPTSKKNKWILDHLQFLTPHMVARTTTSNLEIPIEQSSEAGEADCTDEERELNENQTIESEKALMTVSPRPLSRMCNDSETSSEINMVNARSTKRPTKQKLPAKIAKKRREDREFEILEGLQRSISNEASNETADISEIESFCQYVSKSLKKFNEKTQNVVKHGIQNLIFQAEMGIGPMQTGSGSAMPVAPQPVYHHHTQPTHVPSSNSETFYEALHGSANMGW